ncbi:hypothetical protein LCGC14_2744470 [marine sediment metagenome]|uniref:Uncharacterized protein n=1 Tax=marine sediment metagenome TaxID=412755 RepID=A0A0F8Z3L1_9ZZZZ
MARTERRESGVFYRINIEEIKLMAVDRNRVAGLITFTGKEIAIGLGGIVAAVSGELEFPNKFGFQFDNPGMHPSIIIKGAEFDIPFESTTGASYVDDMIRAGKAKISGKVNYRYTPLIPPLLHFTSMFLIIRGRGAAFDKEEVKISRLTE